jgi:tRNA threonylcarbamoyladenosine biosynthesis protein TsaB
MPAQGPVLALDTSTAQAGIALGGNGTLSSLTWDAGRSHTVLLLDQVHRLLELLGTSAGDLAAVAVATGPGAFTGLRVGMGLAKGFVLALNLPLIGVPTLLAAAMPHLDGDRTVVAAIPAGRGRLAWAPFRGSFDQPAPLAAPRNSTAVELAAEIDVLPGPVMVVGELDPGTASVLADGSPAIVPPAALRLRQPTALLEIALRRLERGEFDDAVSLEPVYLGR